MFLNPPVLSRQPKVNPELISHAAVLMFLCF